MRVLQTKSCDCTADKIFQRVSFTDVLVTEVVRGAVDLLGAKADLPDHEREACLPGLFDLLWN